MVSRGREPRAAVRVRRAPICPSALPSAVRRLALLAALLAAPAAHAQVPTDSTNVPVPTPETVPAPEAVPTPPPADDPEANEPDAGDPGTIDDGTGEARGQLKIRPRLAPSALYATNRGFGIGGGVAVDNLTWRGSLGALDVRVQQFALGATASLFTGDPLDTRLYAGLITSASATTRRQFFGTGPFTSGNRALFLPHDEVSAEALVGVSPFGTTVLRVQPSVRYVLDRSAGVRADGPAQLASLTPASQAAVAPVLARTLEGVSVGVEVATDFRDWAPYPKTGVFAAVEARRFAGIGGQELTFNRYSMQSVGYLPLDGRTVLIASFTGVVTRQGDADGDGAPDAVPYYYLPTLDDRVAVAYRQERLTARDVLAVGLGVRVPVADFIGVYGIDALVVGYLGNAYDNVFEQFSPRVTFRQDPRASESGRAALRPALGLGLGVVNLDKERVVLGALIGVGAGGITVATLRAAYNLRDSRPLFR